jgi:hypothetical protein
MRPPDVSWVVAVLDSEQPATPAASGILVDRSIVLTAKHVANAIPPERQRIAFPLLEPDRGEVRAVVRQHSDGSDSSDIVALELDGPAPREATPAAIRTPTSSSLANLQGLWWSFGFPGDRLGNDSSGTVGAGLGGGVNRLDTESKYAVSAGCSGAGVWSPDYDAVVAMVLQADGRGSARALTLFQTEVLGEVPLRELGRRLDSGQMAGAADTSSSAWGDVEGDFRRVADPGVRIAGDSLAMMGVLERLRRAESNVCLVVGESEHKVLRRVVQRSIPDVVHSSTLGVFQIGLLIESVEAGFPTPIVNCAIDVRNKTAIEILRSVLVACSADLRPLRDGVVNLPLAADAFEAALGQMGFRSFNVVVDGLSMTSTDHLILMGTLFIPLAGKCGPAGLNFIIGIHPHPDYEWPSLRHLTRLGRVHGGIIADPTTVLWTIYRDLTYYQLSGSADEDSRLAASFDQSGILRSKPKAKEKPFQLAGFTPRVPRELWKKTSWEIIDEIEEQARTGSGPALRNEGLDGW